MLIPIGLLFICQTLVFGQTWNLVKEQDDIKIYTRQEKGNSLKSYKGVADVRAPAEEVFALIENANEHDWWGEGISQVRILLYEKNKRTRYYLEYELPWPLSNRDLAVEVINRADPDKGIFTSTAVAITDAVPEYKDKVRIKNYHQTWTICSAGKYASHVVLEGYVDPAGKIPDWISNMAVSDSPVNAIKGLKGKLEDK